MPGLNYDPNSIRSTYKDEHLSKHYVKEYFGEGTIGGDEGFYLKDIQDGAGVTIKRGDLVEYPELWPAPKFPTAIITDIFRYKSGEKANKNKIEVQFENGDKAEMRPNEVFKRDVEAEEAHREHVIQDIKSELHKKWSPGDWVETGSSGTIRGIRGKVLSVSGNVVTLQDQVLNKRKVPANSLKEIVQQTPYKWNIGDPIHLIADHSQEGTVYDRRPDQHVLISIKGKRQWVHENAIESDSGPGEGYHWEAGPEDFVNVKGVSYTSVEERPDAGVKQGHVWTPWEIIQYDKGKRYIHGTNDREGWIFPEAFL